MMGRRAALLAFAITAALSGLAGCANTEAIERQAASETVGTIPPGVVPSDLLGLQVTSEQVSSVMESKDAYVDSVALYGLRKGDLLQGTLQVSHFNEEAQADSARFRRAVIGKIGGAVPRRYRLGDDEVWFTSATKQLVAAWFKGDNFFILSTREDYATPRALVRKALEIEP